MSRHRFLLDYHRVHAGVTSRILTPWLDGRGRSSYRRLAQEAAGLGPSASVLDIGCGDGYLLEQVAELTQAKLSGVDMSPDELKLARNRLGPRAELYEARAQHLPLPDHAFDLILSHIAIAVMTPIEPVFSEMFRVLKPGGRMVFHVNDPDFSDPVPNVFFEILRSLRKRERVWGWFLGDRRMYRIEGLRELVASVSPRADCKCEKYCLERRDDPEAIWDVFASYYDVFLLSPAGREALIKRTWSQWDGLGDENGKLHCRYGMCIFRVESPIEPRRRKAGREQ